ncbi:hypothetical protein K503DRAFT_832706 [Rhizopogon vinicolor AM-OR11-026]|uniref:Uncharacterized protein n=1 Tax=Rhizopogon vinicolor AM-OR11-026 TaxID=1314800 RepID=A0A1B7MPX4_9AGAM|nr:hypothetical protein K503DRAFT_832706 [Rhizopogon vinicolor AM-OR11-026]
MGDYWTTTALSVERTCAKDRSGKNTPSNCPVLTMRTSSGTKKNGKEQRVKSPSSYVTAASSTSVVKTSAITRLHYCIVLLLRDL